MWLPPSGSCVVGDARVVRDDGVIDRDARDLCDISREQHEQRAIAIAAALRSGVMEAVPNEPEERQDRDRSGGA